jgi:hypothetical protein
MMFYNDIDKSQHPIGFYEGIKATYGDLKDEQTYKKWAKDVFANTMILMMQNGQHLLLTQVLPHYRLTLLLHMLLHL